MNTVQSGNSSSVGERRFAAGDSQYQSVDRRTALSTLVAAGFVAAAGCLGDDGADDAGDEPADSTDDGDEDVEPALEVSTGEATDVEPMTATLTGELVTVAGLDVADLGFEYGPAGEELAESVDGGDRDSPGSFEQAVEELDPDTEYEFRAVAQADGQTDEGAVESFTTGVPEPDYTVIVDGAEFDPDELTIAVGETVEWVFEGSGHNVFVEEAPEESDWEGTEGLDTYSEGHVHQHTFQIPGTYEYFCQPHRNIGMEGTIEVEP